MLEKLKKSKNNTENNKSRVNLVRSELKDLKEEIYEMGKTEKQA